MSRIGKTVSGRSGAVATVAATVPLVALGIGGWPAAADDGRGAVVVVEGLRDLKPAQADPLDGAQAQVTITERDGSTYFTFRLQVVDRTASARTFGAHLHNGPCVAGNGGAAGPHYNDEAIHGDPTPVADRDTEVWLDFQVNAGGAGHALVSVPFEVVPAERSIVVHALPTAPGGGAGDRLACIPVDLR